ncbi:MAG: hypothetical protein M3P87_08735 [Actinomycetota bacterium]|nr:hypothetical protein [Actinomycetota bacterium]
MVKYWRWLSLMAALTLSASACTGNGSDASTTVQPVSEATSAAGQEPTCPTEGEVLETAKLYVEHNATDADTGVHGLFGGEAWSELCLWDPNGQLIMLVDPQGPLGDLTVSDLFFESREPPNDEFSMDDLKAAFPEGEYKVGGTDFERIPRVGVALFTHDVPAEPDITAPVLAEDEETAGEAIVSSIGMVVTWDPVTELVSGDSLTVTGYEVIVTKVDHDDPNGWSRPVYDVHVGPDATSLSVPVEFFEPATVYELEVLAIEVSGNQTISVGFFTTE